MYKRTPLVLSVLVFICLTLHAFSAQATQETYTDAQTGMEFVRVAGGCFQMGSEDSEPGRFSDEGPRRQICVDDFMISKFEVTNAQYRQYVPAHDSRSHENKSLDGDNQPVVFVSWREAKAYADWLSRKTRQSFRLPKEAEWEFAARAGSDQARFWGDSEQMACSYANIGDQTAEQNWRDWARWPVFGCSDGFTVSAPVGSFKPNPLGLYDMLGNVWEWTEDRYEESYAGLSASLDSVKTPRTTDKALRGGSWYSGPRNARHARRSWYRADGRCNSLGFRLVMDVP